MKLYLGLVHHPIKNKRGDVVTTSVTNLDIHDISRSCRTFNVKEYYIVTPVRAQHELLHKILGHWQDDKASDYNPDRFDALARTRHVNSIEDGIARIEEIEGIRPFVVATGANFKEYEGNEQDLVNRLKSTGDLDKLPIFILFGTGWGLTTSLVDGADYRLEPLFGNAEDGYNHLSVRSAVAIYLDRFANTN